MSPTNGSDPLSNGSWREVASPEYTTKGGASTTEARLGFLTPAVAAERENPQEARTGPLALLSKMGPAKEAQSTTTRWLT